MSIIIQNASFGSPKFITNGLILALDAANPKSYVGSGTAWSDISGKSNNGTLTNGPTFNSSNGGSIFFDAVNDYVGIPFTTILNDCTFSVWFKNTSTKNYQYLISLGNTSNSVNSFHIDLNDGDLGNVARTVWVYWNSNGSLYSVVASAGSVGDWSDSTWRNYVFTRSSADTTRHYMNGIEVTSGVTRNGSQTSQFGGGAGYALDIGRYANGLYGGIEYGGNVGNVFIYNRALTAQEVYQNYNSHKPRYQ